MARHIDFGKKGEDLAQAWLVEKGFEVLHRNWRMKRCEVDIIARYRGIYHFIEVKSGQSDGYGHPEERVSKKKIRNMMRGAVA
ncbi:MAG TPA: YraN family protein, partial [Puia sp.]|nr:YraN family protein [Puia sp.]